MTLNAVVLVDVDPPLTDSVFNSLKDLKQIKEISSVYGIHDIFLLINVSDEKELNEFIFKKLRPTEGVRETLTLMVTRSVKKD